MVSLAWQGGGDGSITIEEEVHVGLSDRQDVGAGQDGEI